MAAEISVVVCGARGKMGRTVSAAIAAQPDMALVAEVDLGDDLAAALGSGAVAMVDFTAPDAAFENARAAIAAGVAPVVGTTGMSAEQVNELARRADSSGTGGAVIPNFAIGAVLMMRLAEVAAPYFESAEVIEAHSHTKADAPSGTALATARRLAAARREPLAYARPQKVTLENTRGGEEGSVGVHSLRLPGVVADQDVIFGAQGQTLTIAHRTTSREAFMPGVMATIRSVVRERLFYRSLDQVLGLPAVEEDA
jgi:4-hydroxy-tetrahydrodipicolinate reductase